MSSLPSAGPRPSVTCTLRSRPADFFVEEELGFEADGDGEHVFLQIEKTLLNTADLQTRLAGFAGVHPRDVGYSGLKDRVAVTRQWFSIGMAGKQLPDWRELEEEGSIRVLAVSRHRRKLKRGVHRANRFRLMLRSLAGPREELEIALERVSGEGVPNYFGEQRFGRDGNTLAQAQRWAASDRRLSRNKRGLFLSALRAQLFNRLLAERVEAGDWMCPRDGEVCQLQGSRSLFRCEKVDAGIVERAASMDLHPALPLWGRGMSVGGQALRESYERALLPERQTCQFLEEKGLELSWRAARLLPDDFSWQFCDDDGLLITFSLPAGGYATAVLAELVNYNQGDTGSGNSSE